MTNKKVARLLLGISAMFLILIIYITAFDLINHDNFVDTSTAKEDTTVRRGSIYDRNSQVLAESTGSVKKQKREYPYKDIYAHLIGYYTTNGYGSAGMESIYNTTLFGTSNSEGVSDLVSFYHDTKLAISGVEEKRGSDITLTIDNDLQQAAYNALGNYKGAIVVMNPGTGEIYAMVSKPSFDPTPETIATYIDGASSSSDGYLTHRAVSGSYLPGSVFKIIDTAAIIENRMTDFTIDENTKIRTPSANYGQEKKISSEVDLETAFRKSSNIYFCEAAIELGADKVTETAERFLFTEEITMDKMRVFKSTLPAEDERQGYGGVSNLALGQGLVTVSPLQMAMIASAIANDGVMMQPYVIKEISSPFSYEADPETLKRCVSSTTAEKIKDLMLLCVKSGSGSGAAIYGKDVCGKTGTAEIDTKTGEANANFVGFAPYDDPEVAIAVVLENVPDKVTGGSAAAPIAKVVLEKYFKIFK